MFSWTISERVNTIASPQDIWAIWKDVQNWPQWDKDLEWCSIDGPFEEGTRGQLKPKNWLVTTFLITTVNHEKSFSDETRMPFTRVSFNHEINQINGENQIIHSVSAKGLLAPLLKLTLGRPLKKEFKKTLMRLALHAENRPSKGKI